MKKTNLTKKIMAIMIGIIMVIGMFPFSAAVCAAPASVTVEVICNTYYGTVIGDGSYNTGDTVTLTATPAEDMEFAYWLDATVQLDDDPSEEELKAAIVSYDAEYTFTAEQNIHLEAVFFGTHQINIWPMLITGTDEESLKNAKWVNESENLDTVILGTEPISLPGETIETIITIDDKQYEFMGFIVFGYDAATDTETVEFKEAMTISAMPIYNSTEYWEWFTPISDGIYGAYMEYTPEDDDPQEPSDPAIPNNPQEPTDPDTPNDPQGSTDPITPDNSESLISPQTDDINHLTLWIALILISGGTLITLTVPRRKKRSTKR